MSMWTFLCREWVGIVIGLVIGFLIGWNLAFYLAWKNLQ